MPAVNEVALSAITDLNDPRLVKALAHPLRIEILQMLGTRTMSPSQLGKELDVPLPNIAYHFRMLVQLGLVKEQYTRQRRGAIEHYYKTVGRAHLAAGAWEKLPEQVKHRAIQATLEEMSQLISAGLAVDGFAQPYAALNSRVVMLDEKARKRLAKAIADVQSLIDELENDTAARDGDKAQRFVVMQQTFSIE